MGIWCSQHRLEHKTPSLFAMYQLRAWRKHSNSWWKACKKPPAHRLWDVLEMNQLILVQQGELWKSIFFASLPLEISMVSPVYIFGSFWQLMYQKTAVPIVMLLLQGKRDVSGSRESLALEPPQKKVVDYHQAPDFRWQNSNQQLIVSQVQLTS